jgi:hypothetical protein
LVKIKNGSETKYFPLFDMAGTEDPIQMQKFFNNNGNNSNKYQNIMEKIIKVINDAMIENNTIIDEQNTKITSLQYLIDNDETTKKFINDRLSREQRGGENKKMNELLQDDNTIVSETPNVFIKKIIREGYYINHTIGMLMFASKCIGKCINSQIINGKDSFDNIGIELFSEMKNIVYVTSQNVDEPIEQSNKTRLLLDDLTYDNILSRSCIWLQILFSFLYWNKESDESKKILLSDTNGSQFWSLSVESSGYFIVTPVDSAGIKQIGKKEFYFTPNGTNASR